MESIQYLTTIFVEGVEQEFEVISYAEAKYTASERGLDFFRRHNIDLKYKNVEYMKTIKYPHTIEKDMLVDKKTRI